MTGSAMDIRRRVAGLKTPRLAIDMGGDGGANQMYWVAITGVHTDSPATGDTMFTGSLYRDPDAGAETGVVTIKVPGYEGSNYPTEKLLAMQYRTTWTGAASSHTEDVYAACIFTWWGDVT